MKISINLSSEPFRPHRAILAGSITLGALLTASLIFLSMLAVRERSQMSATRAAVDRLTANLAAVQREQAVFDSTLRKPENAEVLARSLLLNQLIDRKAISWTKIFSDLEKVTPYNVRLMQVRLPQITSQNVVVLDVVVGAQSSQAIIDFVKKLENSTMFGPPELHDQQPPSQTNPLFQSRVTVTYAQKL